ncbi:hypothetical protein Tco_0052168 [Tanacetum coccineum]
MRIQGIASLFLLVCEGFGENGGYNRGEVWELEKRTPQVIKVYCNCSPCGKGLEFWQNQTSKIEQRSQKEQPTPSVVFWLEHRMRKEVGYLRDMMILDMSGQGMWIYESIKPLHFKPMCLASDCAKSGIAIKVVLPSYNASVHLQYYDGS